MNRAAFAQIKKRFPDKLLIVREGKEYRLYGGDALKGGRDLGLHVVNLIGLPPFVSIPYNEAEKYLVKLLGAGHKIVICEESGAEEVYKQEAFEGVPAPAIGTGQVNWPVEQITGAKDRRQEDLFAK